MQAGYEDRAIPESLAERGPTPDNVFCFPDVISWRERIWTLISDIVTEDVKRCEPPVSEAPSMRTFSVAAYKPSNDRSLQQLTDGGWRPLRLLQGRPYRARQ